MCKSKSNDDFYNKSILILEDMNSSCYWADSSHRWRAELFILGPGPSEGYSPP